MQKEGKHNGHREKAFRYWKTGFLSAIPQNFALLHMNNRYKYNNQQSKYKKDSEGRLFSNKCTFCKLIDPDTEQIESRENLYMKCDNSIKVLPILNALKVLHL